ncbi:MULTISPECIES: allantoinase AllB [Paraliobacillus]|uniref:allantoinase AllB n=1 Tax=Paraliobacillus TaxID=200903 RepID=UPI000DD2DC44|nr:MULTISPECIES: allantoinase AllB [Paraliobacillus]
MEILDLLIRNGNVVLADRVENLSIGVKDGKIVQIEKKIDKEAIKVIDANDLYVFPGMIDVHVHFNEPGRTDWEGFETGSNMLAAGGITTFFDMPLNGIPSTITLEAFKEKNAIANKKARIDFKLWGGLVPGNLDQLAALSEAGVVGFKAFLSASGNDEFEAADDWTLLEGMREIAAQNKVLALHAESRTITDFLTKEMKQKNATTAIDYSTTRPIIAEVEAVERALAYAKVTSCALHFVHISSAAAIDRIEQAQLNGLDVTVETCPHYLLYNQDDLVNKGAVAKCAPPLREENERLRLIEKLREGKIDMISSDHSPAPFDLKDPSQYDLLHAWGGISGGQFSLMAMIELAQLYRIPFEEVGNWCAFNPAKRFKQHRKGAIEVGYDADIAIVDLNKETIVKPDNFLAKHKETLYMDRVFPCKVIETFSRGNSVYSTDLTE